MEDKLRDVFAESLGISASSIDDSLEYGRTPQWDSVAHMALIAAIETAFDIMIETEDVIDMSSFAKAKQILAKY